MTGSTDAFLFECVFRIIDVNLCLSINEEHREWSGARDVIC